NYNGTDSFTYKVNNGVKDSNTSTVTVNIAPVNDQPTAEGQSISTDEDTQTSVTMTASDAETPAADLTFSVTQAPTHGSLTGAGPNLTYTPAANFNGSDSFKFTVTDSGDGSSAALTSSEATVAITVNPVNDPPVANTDSATLNEDGQATISVLAN